MIGYQITRAIEQSYLSSPFMAERQPQRPRDLEATTWEAQPLAPGRDHLQVESRPKEAVLSESERAHLAFHRWRLRDSLATCDQ